eukprot:GHVU01053671.1.p1 GENE.GHVU01053671.1~~GHVU01053671.1.p1  ORF type:complete len:257 (-),score=25.96 GHVU01053671.1:517-1287(-)
MTDDIFVDIAPGCRCKVHQQLADGRCFYRAVLASGRVNDPFQKREREKKKEKEKRVLTADDVFYWKRASWSRLQKRMDVVRTLWNACRETNDRRYGPTAEERIEAAFLEVPKPWINTATRGQAVSVVWATSLEAMQTVWLTKLRVVSVGHYVHRSAGGSQWRATDYQKEFLKYGVGKNTPAFYKPDASPPVLVLHYPSGTTPGVACSALAANHYAFLEPVGVSEEVLNKALLALEPQEQADDVGLDTTSAYNGTSW